MPQNNNAIITARSDFNDALSYLSWCVDEPEYDDYGDQNTEKYVYCYDFINSIKEIFKDLVCWFEEQFDFEYADPEEILAALSRTMNIPDYSDLYYEIHSLTLSKKYGIVGGDIDANFENIGVQFETMLDTLASVEWESADEE